MYGGEKMWEDLFEDIQKMQKDMEKMFSQISKQIKFPEFKEAATDISETEDKIIIKVDMPGVKKEDIDLAITENSISIKAERKEAVEEKKGDFYRKERMYKGYNVYRTLPAKVKPETADAKYEDGVLTIEIEKSEKEKEVKKVEVK